MISKYYLLMAITSDSYRIITSAHYLIRTLSNKHIFFAPVYNFTCLMLVGGDPELVSSIQLAVNSVLKIHF